MAPAARRQVGVDIAYSGFRTAERAADLLHMHAIAIVGGGTSRRTAQRVASVFYIWGGLRDWRRVHTTNRFAFENGQGAVFSSMSAAFSPIMIDGALVLPDVSVGMIEASAIRRPVMP